MKRRSVFIVCILLIITFLADCAVQPTQTLTTEPRTSASETISPGIHLDLKDGWELHSSAKVNESGEVISTKAYQPPNWYPISVPATVMAGLLQNNVYQDIFTAQNLTKVNPQDFDVSWWYRSEFTLPASENGKKIWLNFQGINYRANIWLNGMLIADKTQVVGAFREYQFDITGKIAAGDGVNVLAVEVFPPQEGDLTIHFVDWNPTPPDHNMGLFNGVYVTASGPVVLQHPLVITKFDLPSLDMAHLTVVAELKNGTSQSINGTLEGSIENVTFKQDVQLGANETKTISFKPEDTSQLNLSKPRIWWPWQYGSQELYELNLTFKIGGAISDQLTTHFGVCQISTEMLAGNTLFIVNGKRILIRGAAWTPDMFQRRSPERQEAEFRYVRDMNLNAIRLEGKFEDDHFFDLADQYGILILEGWCCCDVWQSPGTWGDEQKMVANESLKTQLYRLRNHPSILVWMNGSDMPPSVGSYDPFIGSKKVEQDYLDIEAQLQWPNPILSNASEVASEITGPTGVKMLGPYEWVPPIYWTTDNHRAGGAWSFATEISPGPAVPPLDSLKQMLGSDHLWPMDEVWMYHTGGGEFSNLDVFNAALNARYGLATSALDYSEKAQVMAYESHRAMFEAYSANKYRSTGVIQWMLNNAWPSMIWHLYDYYLRPGGSYFGTKTALQPIHVQYSYNNHSIFVVNSTLKSYENLWVTADIYNLDGKSLYHDKSSMNIKADGAIKVLVIPTTLNLPTTYFLRLTLTDTDNKVLDLNTYWLSTSRDLLNWNNSDWYYTPVAKYADFTSLQSLPTVNLTVSDQIEQQDDEQIQTITITNPGTNIAFFIHLTITRGTGGEELLPVLWEDNYFTLLPGESRTVRATYLVSDLGTDTPVLAWDCWNNIEGK